MSRLSSIALVFALFGLPSLADEIPCAMTYEQFEFAVPHLDLEACPQALEGDARFCRVSAASDALHVFVFAEEGAQCLLATRSFDEDAFALVID